MTKASLFLHFRETCIRILKHFPRDKLDHVKKDLHLEVMSWWGIMYDIYYMEFNHSSFLPPPFLPLPHASRTDESGVGSEAQAC